MSRRTCRGWRGKMLVPFVWPILSLPATARFTRNSDNLGNEHGVVNQCRRRAGNLSCHKCDIRNLLAPHRNTVRSTKGEEYTQQVGGEGKRGGREGGGREGGESLLSERDEEATNWSVELYYYGKLKQNLAWLSGLGWHMCLNQNLDQGSESRT